MEQPLIQSEEHSACSTLSTQPLSELGILIGKMRAEEQERDSANSSPNPDSYPLSDCNSTEESAHSGSSPDPAPDLSPDSTSDSADNSTPKAKSSLLSREELDKMWEEECDVADMLLECEQYAVDLTKEYIEPIPVIEMEGTLIGSEGNLSAVVGEAKSKKTFLCSAIVGDMLRIVNDRRFGISKRLQQVLWVDTEQSEFHARKVARRILDLCQSPDPDQSPFFKMLSLREFDPIKRKDMLYKSIRAYRPKLVVIDGISDLQRNTNDLEESEAIVTTLMALSTIYNCHIMCVLHTNPGTDKARGHTGSALQRKAETVLYVRKVGEVSVVEPQFCRNEPFERFAFRVDDEGLPELCDLPNEGNEAQNAVVKVMRDYFPDGVSRTTLTNKVMEVLGTSRNTSNVKIFRAIRKGLLEVSGDDVFLR